MTIYSPAYRGLTAGVLTTVVLVAFEALAVTTVMNVTARDLEGLALYAWSFSGFFAASLVGMIVSGEVSDSRGPRLPFLAGVGGFAVGLVVAGTAPSMPLLVAGRVLQGLGAGMLIVALYVIVVKLYPEELRPAAFGVMAMGWVVPSLVGPAVAGWVADAWTWRAVFLAVPVLVVPAVLVMLPRLAQADPDVTAPLPRAGRKRRAVAVAAGVVVLQYAGEHLGWGSLVAVAVAVGLLAPSLPRLLPAGTLRLRRGLPTVIAQRGLLMGALLGAEAFIPLMLVTERGLSPALAGTTLTGGALAWAGASWLQGRLSAEERRWLLIRTGGALLGVGIGIVSLALVHAVSPLVAVAGWTVAGFGLGLSIASISVLAFRLSPETDRGAVSAAIQLSDALGSVVFVALAGVLYSSLRTEPGHDGPAFAAVFAVMGVLAVATGVSAGRIRTRSHAES
ncbi:MAG: MFS transporter [Actinomycetes bacterium]